MYKSVIYQTNNTSITKAKSLTNDYCFQQIANNFQKNTVAMFFYTTYMTKEQIKCENSLEYQEQVRDSL